MQPEVTVEFPWRIMGLSKRGHKGLVATSREPSSSVCRQVDGLVAVRIEFESYVTLYSSCQMLSPEVLKPVFL